MRSDRPINNIEEDIFGRSEFIKNLAQEIKTLSSNESIVIGLSGPWGSGKTSVVNLITKELNITQQEGYVNPGDVIIVRFSPWNHINNNSQDEAYFVKAFFDALREKLRQQANGGCWKTDDVKELFDAIDEYVNLLSPGILRSTANIIIRRRKRKTLEKRATIESAKEEVLNATSFLRDCNIKILIVIDDIDRLPKEQTRLVFQLITSIADFPSVNYLIAFDEEIVAEALSEIQGGSGRKYLEKVIQVPIIMPEASTTAIRAEIIRRFEYVAYLGNRKSNDGSNDFSFIASAVQSCILSIRDVNRLDNALRFKLKVLGEQVNPVDLFALEALRIICPSIINWINRHRFALCVYTSKDTVITSIQEKVIQDIKQEFSNDFTNELIDIQSAFRIIDLLFIASRKNYSDCNVLRADIHQRKRACDLEIFELYLNGDLSTISDMSNSLFDVIQSGDELSFSSYIYQAYRNGRYLEAIESLLPVTTNFSPEIAENALRAVAKNLKFADRSSVSFSENTRTIDLFESLLKALEAQGELLRENTILDIFEQSDDTETISLAEFIVRQERALGRNGFQGSGYKQYVDAGYLELIEERFVCSMKNLFKANSLMFIENIYVQLALLKQLDIKAFSEMLMAVSSNALCLVLIAEAYVGTWSGYESGRSVSGYYTNDNIHESIETASIINSKNVLLSNKRFWKIHHDTQMKTATLILSAEKNRFGALNDSFDTEELEEQLEEWRNKFFNEEDDDSDEDLHVS